MDYITIALPKGKLFTQAKELLAEVGWQAENLFEDSRKLVIANEELKIRFIITKAVDLPTYVEYGAADIGIIGKDVLIEEQKNVYELLDLKFGVCRLALAMPELSAKKPLTDFAPLRVATKYPRSAKDFFLGKGIQAEIIKLNGSIELAPMVGLAEMIVDIVETGKTLRENRLAEVETVYTATARLIANRVSFKLKFERLHALVQNLRKVVEGEELK